MDASIILSALQYGADAIAQGILNETGKKIFESLESKTKAVAPTTDIKELERSSGPQETKSIILQRISGATKEQQEELANLAHALLSVIEQHKSAHWDAKVDLMVERVRELFERHSIDRPTMAEILGVSLSTLKGHGLVDHLDNKKLDELEAKFAVSREWLLGDVDYSSNCACRWYKSPSTAIYRLIQLAVDEKRPSIYFIRSNRIDPEEVIREEERDSSEVNLRAPTIKIAVIVELTHDTSSGRSFNSYERWESLNWDYWKSRWCLLQLVMFCERIAGAVPQGR